MTSDESNYGVTWLNLSPANVIAIISQASRREAGISGRRARAVARIQYLSEAPAVTNVPAVFVEMSQHFATLAGFLAEEKIPPRDRLKEPWGGTYFRLVNTVVNPVSRARARARAVKCSPEKSRRVN